MASSARLPLDRGYLDWLPAALVACRPWAGPSGVAALLSGRAGLLGKRSCPGAGGRSGLVSGGAGALLLDYMYIQKPLTLNLANPAEKGLLALVFWLSGWHQYLSSRCELGIMIDSLLWP